MSLLLFTARKYSLMSQKEALNYKIFRLREDLIDLQKYAAAIADGVSFNDLAQAPPKYFSDMMSYAIGADKAAKMALVPRYNAVNNMMLSLGTWNQIPNDMRVPYAKLLQNQMYEQERERIAKIETKKLDIKEREINAQLEKYQTQLKMIEAEEQKVDSAQDKAIQRTAPKYVA